MVDKQFFQIAAAVGGAIAILLAILGGLYNTFIADVSTTGAIIIAAMGGMLYAVLVLAIDNRIRINNMGGDDL